LPGSGLVIQFKMVGLSLVSYSAHSLITASYIGSYCIQNKLAGI